MPRFAANLTMLFTELPFMERFEAAARAGFEAVEYLFPYAFDRKELAAALRANGLQQVLHNLPAGNWDGGERGIACHPDRVSEFQEGVGRAIDYATALGCPRLNCLAGKLPVGAAAAGRAPDAGREPALRGARAGGRGHRPGDRADQQLRHPRLLSHAHRPALALLDEVGSGNLKVQYDIYHAQRMEGELGNTLARNIARIGHIQLADNPGRGEPGTGEINYAWLFGHIDTIGYAGWIGCEYKPRTATTEGLGWRQALAH